MHCGVVLIVSGVGRHVDVEAGDATLFVDVLPEVLLSGDDLGRQGSEGALGEVRQHAEVDAPVVGVDRLRTGLIRDTNVEDDAITRGCALRTRLLGGGRVAASAAAAREDQGSRPDAREDLRHVP